MEKMPQSPKRPEAQEDTKSVLLRSETVNKRITSQMSPETIEAALTVETFSRLNPAEITVDDRGYVYTKSGNVYRIDRSESRPALLKLLNQNTGNNTEYIAPMPDKSAMIQVGEQMHFASLKDPDDFTKGATANNSSEVERIEVWRNYLKARREIEADLKARHSGTDGFGAMAKGLGNAAGGGVRVKDYTKKS